MTREQMIDAAVRRSMKPATMMHVDYHAKIMAASRAPRTTDLTDAGVALRAYPGRVKKICVEYRRIAEAAN